MQRGPKPGKARAARPRMVDAIGDPPASLGPLGCEIWADAVAHLAATGRASRMYRHPLLILCELLVALRVDDAPAGVQRLDTVRRWMNELGLTPASSKGTTTEGTPQHGEATTGKARLLELVA